MRGDVEQAHGGTADEHPASRGLGGIDRGVVAADREASGGNAGAGTVPAGRGESGRKSRQVREPRREAEERNRVVGAGVPPRQLLGGNSPLARQNGKVRSEIAAVRDGDPEPPGLPRRSSGFFRETTQAPDELLPLDDPRIEEHEKRRRARDRVQETPWRLPREPVREGDRRSVCILPGSLWKFREERRFGDVAGLELHETRGATRSRRRHRKYTGIPVATSAYPGHVVLGLPASSIPIRTTPAAA